MSKTILFAVGGTGGHLFPALATAEALKKIDPGLSVAFAGGGVKNPQIFAKTPYSYHLIESASLSLKNPYKAIKNGMTLLKGWQNACRLLDRLNVSAVVGFGSHYSFPVLLAAQWKKIPYALHEQNFIPGRVVRFFSKKALFTGVHFAGTRAFLKGKSLNVGLPLRDGYAKGCISKEKALDYFSLNKDQQTLLLFGGSQGAEFINRFFASISWPLPFQVLHFTGSSEEAKRVKSFYHEHGITSCVKDFEGRMDFAWSAADLAITRGGGASIAELLEFEVPAIIIPYPFAMDNHQEYNADFFVRGIGGGRKILEKEMQHMKSPEFLEQMMQPGSLHEFKKNIQNYKKQNEQNNFAKEIISALCLN